jgi:O-antigen ligase
MMLFRSRRKGSTHHIEPAEFRKLPLWLVVTICVVSGVVIATLPTNLRLLLLLGLIGLPIGIWILTDLRRTLLVYGFLIPLDLYLSLNLRFTSNQVFQVLLITSGILGLLGKSRVKKTTVPRGNWPWLWGLVIALSCYAICSLAWSVDPSATARALFRLLVSIGTFWIIIQVLREASQLDKMITAICLGAAVVVVYGLLQYFRRGYDDLYPLFSPFYQELWLARGSGFSIVSTFVNPNMLAAYGLMVLPLTLSKMSNSRLIRRIWWTLCASGVAVTIILTYSKAGWISLVLVLLAWSVLNFGWRRKLVVAIVSVLVIVIVCFNFSAIAEQFNILFPNAQEVSVDIRLDVWGIAVSSFLNNPILGYGLDGFTTATESLRSGTSASELIRAHNLYLQTLVDLGIVGFILYFGVIMVITIKGIKVYRRLASIAVRRRISALLVSVFGFLVYALFDALNGFNSYNMLQWVIFGLLTASILVGSPGGAGLEPKSGRALDSLP